MKVEDEDEAREAFVLGYAERDPLAAIFRTDRAAAVKDLLEGVLRAARAAGYDAGSEGRSSYVSHPNHGAVYLVIEDETLLLAEDKRSGPLREIESVAYDYVEKTFVSAGTTARSAAAQVARQVSDLITAQSDKKGGS